MYIVYNKRKKWWKEYSYPFLVESYWDGKKSRRRTLAKLSWIPEDTVNSLKLLLQKKDDITSISGITVEKSIDYGECIVMLEIMKKLKIDKTLKTIYKENYNLALLIILWKIITRWSKLNILNWIKKNDVIADKLWINTSNLTEKYLYSVMYDINSLQEKIEKKWYLNNKNKLTTIYLYDITSFYFEWTQNELSAYWYDRDKKKWKKIITTWLITDENGFPLKIKAFKWNIIDHKTVKEQIEELKQEFWVEKIIFVWDRWMKIRYNLENMDEVDKESVSYISWLTTDEIKKLDKEGIIQLTMEDKQLVEIENWDKRLIVCRNPKIAEDKRTRRESMKLKFENELANIQSRHEKIKERCDLNKENIKNWEWNKKLKTEFTDKEIDNWKYKIRKYQEKYKMKNIYDITITKEDFKIEYKASEYQKLWIYDWVYVLETTVEKETLTKEEVRKTYKKLQKIEHAFHNMKTWDLNLRPIFHRKEETTRAHILLWMFSYAIINYMETKIYPRLTTEKKKDKISFDDIIQELKNIKYCLLSFENKTYTKSKITKLTKIQKKILDLLWISQDLFI